MSQALNENEIPCQAVCNKITLDLIPGELKDLRILFKNIAVMHGKCEFSKVKGRDCSIPIEDANICNILPRPAVSNGLKFAK